MNRPIRSFRKSGAIRAGILFGCGLVGVVFALTLGGFNYLSRKQQSILDREIEAVQPQKDAIQAGARPEGFAATVAKGEQQKAITELRAATNFLQKLNGEVTQLLRTGDQLLTNGLGTNDPAKRYFLKAVGSIPTLAEIRAKVSHVEVLLAGVEALQGTTALPDSHSILEGKKLTEWAAIASETVAAAREKLEQIIKSGRADDRDIPIVPVSEGDSINVAAKPGPAVQANDGVNITADYKAALDKILADTRTEVAQLLSDTRKEAQRILAETTRQAETILVATKTQTRAGLSEPPPSKATTLDSPATEPQPQAVEAETPIQPTATDVVVPSESRLEPFELDSQMREQLLPFTAPGTMRLPGVFRLQKVPMSLSQMKSFGALEPTPAGLAKLVEIASAPGDAIRPRWKFKIARGVWQQRPREVAQASAVQQYLRDFGPQLITEGLLVP